MKHVIKLLYKMLWLKVIKLHYSKVIGIENYILNNYIYNYFVTVISIRAETVEFGGMLSTTLPAPSEKHNNH